MLVLLGILVFVYHFGMGIYSAGGLEPSPAFEFLYRAAFLCCVVWWLRADAPRYAVKLVYCLGLLVGVGWMIIIPYHLFKTRGVRGLIPLSALIGSFLAAHLLAVLVYMIFSTQLL
jgi:polyferredoxin